MRKFAAMITVLNLAGCASMPPVTATYKFPLETTKLAATLTVGCSTDKKRLVAATSITPTNNWGADPNASYTVKFSDYGGSLSDADVTLSYTTDGRLSGINATTTGEGDTVIKDTVTLASAAAGLMAYHVAKGEVFNGFTPAEINTICTNLGNLANGVAGQPKVITLSYTLAILYNPDGTPTVEADPNNNSATYTGGYGANIDFKPDPGSEELAAIFPAKTPTLSLRVVSATVDTPGASWDQHPEWSDADKAPDRTALLKLNKTETYTLEVKGPSGDYSKQETIWRGQVSVPVHKYYGLPVPTGAVFGHENFGFTFTDSGAITKAEYATNSGAPDLLDSAGTVVKALPTNASVAQADSDEIDRIYEQQQLVKCKLDPATCTK